MSGSRASLTKKDRIAIAELWTTALSSTGVKAINVLAEENEGIAKMADYIRGNWA